MCLFCHATPPSFLLWYSRLYCIVILCHGCLSGDWWVLSIRRCTETRTELANLPPPYVQFGNLTSFPKISWCFYIEFTVIRETRIR